MQGELKISHVLKLKQISIRQTKVISINLAIHGEVVNGKTKSIIFLNKWVIKINLIKGRTEQLETNLST